MRITHNWQRYKPSAKTHFEAEKRDLTWPEDDAVAHENYPDQSDAALLRLVVAIAAALLSLLICSVAGALQGSVLAGTVLAGFVGLALWIWQEARHAQRLAEA